MGIADIANVIKDPSSLLAMFGFVPSLINDIIIDVLERETPSYAWEISRHPVEGTDVTDSRVKQPTGLTLDCIFTDMQLSATNIITSVLNGGFSLHTWRDKKEALYTLAESNQVIDVRTPLDLYSNMMIKSITPNQDKTTGSVFAFSIEFERVTTVSSEWGYVDPSDLPVDQQATAVTDSKTTKGATSKGNTPPVSNDTTEGATLNTKAESSAIGPGGTDAGWAWQ